MRLNHNREIRQVAGAAFAILLVHLVAAGICSASVIYVPGDKGAIQDAIDGASNHDTILVSPGTYAENLNFSGKAITLMSTKGRDSTFIEAADQNDVIVRFVTGEDTTSVIDGFTIRHTTDALGIYCSNSNPIIRNCDISYCFNTGDGAGIYCASSGAKIRENRIHNNHGTLTGGGVLATGNHAATLEITWNEIYYNSSANGQGIACATNSRNVLISRNVIWGNVGTGGLAGGIYAGGQNIDIISNTVAGNSKGVMIYLGSAVDVRNNIIVSSVGEGFDVGNSTYDYNDAWNNGSLNNPGANGISLDPMFIDSVNHVFALQSSSPCIDRGDPDPQYNEPDGSRNDIGAYPYIDGGPLAVNINYGPFAVGNVVYLTSPQIFWSYFDAVPTLQEQYEIEVGTDTLWDLAEMWDTGPVSSPDTGVTYGGLPLADHRTYHVRIRVHNGDDWGDWSYNYFFTHFSSLIEIPLDFATIQEGIDAALDGDTVIIYDGHYYETIDFPDKSIVVASLSLLDGESGHIFNTIIDGDTSIIGSEGSASVVSLSAEASPTVSVQLYGLTVQSDLTRNAIGVYDGSYDFVVRRCNIRLNDGVSYLHDSSRLMFDSCIVEGNTGAAICQQTATGYEFNECILSTARIETDCPCEIASSTLDDCIITWEYDRPDRLIRQSYLTACSVYVGTDASATSDSSVFMSSELAFHSSSGILSSSLIEGQTTLSGSYPTLTSTNCTFAGNIDLQSNCDLVVENCILYPNGGSAVSGVTVSATVNATCCDVYNFDGDWIEGEFIIIDTSDVFFLDPFFCDVDDADNYYLYEISPCLPENNGCGVLIGAYDIGCDVGEPQALGIGFGDDVASNLVSHTPTIYWSYVDPLYPTQEMFEIAVGIDDDWGYAEMWNPEPFATPDTAVDYAGASLVNGETYWMRLRVFNSIVWSDWSVLSFRMNSVPTVPSVDSPIDDALVRTLTPDLVIVNSTDAEDDSLVYTFEVSQDSFMSIVDVIDQSEGEGDFTIATVQVELVEDQRYWWRAKASDYFEESGFSDDGTFWVDAENTLPTPFGLMFPPDTAGSFVETLTPEFQWSPSFDTDPLDSIDYTLLVSVDSNFQFVSTTPGIQEPHYLYLDSLLDWGTDYWWKVKALDQNGGEVTSDQVFQFRTVTLGDADGSGYVDIDDIVLLVTFIFQQGAPPQPLFAGDADCTGEVDIDDVVYLIEYVFSHGPEPCAEFPWLTD